MAAFYMNQHQYAKAEQAFTAGISVSPEIPALHSNLGALYFTLSQWEDAEREFRKALAIKPYAPGYSNLGTVLFFKGNYADAARQFEEATKLQPTNHVMWGNLGDARGQIEGERERAREAFQKAYSLASQQLVLNPEDVQLRKSYALYLAKLGRAKEAWTEIEAAIQQAPTDMNVRFYSARVYAVTGDLKRAESAAKTSITLGYDPKEVEREPDLKPLQITGGTSATVH
jgi:predicted Zn-dependent protease